MDPRQQERDEIEEDLVTHRRLAEQEERERFRCFLLTGAVGTFAMAGALLLLKGWLPWLIATLFGGAQLLVWQVGIRPKSNALLRWLNHGVLTAYLVFVIAVSLFTGQSQSFALWFLVLLPIMAAFVNTPPTAGLWLSISVFAAIGVWASENFVVLSERVYTTPDLRAATRVVLILIVGAFSIHARRTSDHRILELAHSLRRESELKLNAEALRQAAEKARAAADAANASKSEFLATMSHEIRTPLNGVIGFNSLLLESPLNEKQREYVELARQSGEVLLGLINDFLDFSKMEANRLELESVPFDPCHLIEDKLHILREGARIRGLDLQHECAAPRSVLGDSNRVGQILMNLVSNAIKFTSRGSVLLRCRELAGDAERVWLRFEIEDTGIGIPGDRLERIFQPFTQADSSTTRHYGGTGLGLAICKSLTEAMGGRIGVSSLVGMGSLFWVELPFERASPSVWPDATGNRASSGAARRPPGSAGHILLVEDNPVNRFMATEMLQRLGFQVDVAANGQEAVDAVRERSFDLILMDCNMPVMDGLAASAAIRAGEPPGRRTPIVAMTASALSGDREKCTLAGMDDFLAKPIRQADLIRITRTWISSDAP